MGLAATTPESIPEPIEVAVALTRVLDGLGVEYLIGEDLVANALEEAERAWA